MKTSDFDYELDPKRIAQTPLEERDHSKLLILDRFRGSIEHRNFYDIIEKIHTGDVVVINETKVIPARLFGSRPGKEERIEVLLLKRNEKDRWETLVRPGKKMKLGTIIEFGGLLRGVVRDISPTGEREIEFTYEGIFYEILERLGTMPLPPYIQETLEDSSQYQTVYAKERGSVAAPTAGLHFTPALMEAMRKKGILFASLVLHVGLGTFRPVSVENIHDHHMHAEYYCLDEKNAQIIQKAHERGGKVIAVGTTSMRTLESIMQKEGSLCASEGWTDIFIYPGFQFKLVDSLITNFHLPKSTLMMLVSAFSTRDFIMNAYREAIEKDYRFFSFGDAMFIDGGRHDSF